MVLRRLAEQCRQSQWRYRSPDRSAGWYATSFVSECSSVRLEVLNWQAYPSFVEGTGRCTGEIH
jgi:hypothetical protein